MVQAGGRGRGRDTAGSCPAGWASRREVFPRRWRTSPSTLRGLVDVRKDFRDIVAKSLRGLECLRPGVVDGVETPPGSCPQGCGFASVALPHRNEIAIMRSAHFLWRSCHVQCDSTSEPTSGKQFARTLVRALPWCRRGVVEGVETPLAVALRVVGSRRSPFAPPK